MVAMSIGIMRLFFFVSSGVMAQLGRNPVSRGASLLGIVE